MRKSNLLVDFSFNNRQHSEDIANKQATYTAPRSDKF